jgi:hypothetical protein
MVHTQTDLQTDTQTIKCFLEKHLGKISDQVYDAAIDALGRDSQQCLNYGIVMSNETHQQLLQTNIDFFRKYLID